MKWTNCVFDLYGTLVDIHTDESAPCLWENLLEHYRTQGAVYSTPQELNMSFSSSSKSGAFMRIWPRLWRRDVASGSGPWTISGFTMGQKSC